MKPWTYVIYNLMIFLILYEGLRFYKMIIKKKEEETMNSGIWMGFFISILPLLTKCDFHFCLKAFTIGVLIILLSGMFSSYVSSNKDANIPFAAATFCEIEFGIYMFAWIIPNTCESLFGDIFPYWDKYVLPLFCVDAVIAFVTGIYTAYISKIKNTSTMMMLTVLLYLLEIVFIVYICWRSFFGLVFEFIDYFR